MHWLNDETRLLFMAVVTSAFPIAVLFGLNLTPEQLAAIELFAGNVLLFVMKVVKAGQGVQGPVSATLEHVGSGK